MHKRHYDYAIALNKTFSFHCNLNKTYLNSFFTFPAKTPQTLTKPIVAKGRKTFDTYNAAIADCTTQVDCFM